MTWSELKHFLTIKRSHKYVSFFPCLQIWREECSLDLWAFVLMIKPIMLRQQAYYTEGLTLPRTLTCGFVHHLPTCVETTMWFLKVFVKGSFITRHVLFFFHWSLIYSLGLKNAIRNFKFQTFKRLKNKFSIFHSLVFAGFSVVIVFSFSVLCCISVFFKQCLNCNFCTSGA